MNIFDLMRQHICSRCEDVYSNYMTYEKPEDAICNGPNCFTKWKTKHLVPKQAQAQKERYKNNKK